MPEATTPTVALRVDVDVKGVAHVRDKLGRFVTNIGKAADKDARLIAKIFSDWLKISLENSTRTGGWTGKLMQSLSRIHGSKGNYSIKIPLYGIYLDRMKPHRVSISREPLKDWIKEKYPDYSSPYIYVKPHPWIDEGLRLGRKYAREVLGYGDVKKEIDKLRR